LSPIERHLRGTPVPVGIKRGSDVRTIIPRTCNQQVYSLDAQKRQQPSPKHAYFRALQPLQSLKDRDEHSFVDGPAARSPWWIRVSEFIRAYWWINAQPRRQPRLWSGPKFAMQASTALECLPSILSGSATAATGAIRPGREREAFEGAVEGAVQA